ncbi:putative uncharacterized protein [Firmicutes bacterium CAG:313]|nr:putative uncharacterized protein [Firmicutes bacterium CAG:313]
MIIYSVIISITLIIVYLLNLLRGCTDILYILKWTSIDILVVFIIDAIIAFVIRRLPEKWFDYKYKAFKIFKWERKFYEAIKIKKWKDKIPELGQLTNFKKNKVREPKNSEYLLRYLMECVYGETIHFLSIILGFLILLINPKCCLYFGLPIAIANGIISYLSFAILRYNRPKLTILYNRSVKSNERYNSTN